MESEKLQKIMARAGLGSRRHNEEMISAGRVTVNGRVAKLGDRADAETDEILVDGEPLRVQKLKYIMLNKPKGVLSSTEDELAEGRKTVRDLVDVEGHLYPVGRLDMQSEGLILLTNDGDLAHRLTHPRYGHKKIYRAWVERQPSQKTLQKWRSGVMLDEKKTLPCEVEILSRGSYVVELKIVLREGRKRQIRRVASQLGHPVRRLVREQIGAIRLSKVQPGEWRYLTGQEVKALKKSVKMGRESAGKSRKMGRGRRNHPQKRRRR